MKTTFDDAATAAPEKKATTPAATQSPTDPVPPSDPSTDTSLAALDDDDSSVVAYQTEGAGTVSGNVTSRDLRFAKLNIVQKSGELADKFKFGTWLINKEDELLTPEQSLKGIPDIVCVKAVKAYREQLPYGSGVQGQVFLTEKEAVDAGFGLDYNDDPKVSPELRCLFYVPQPEGIKLPHIFTLGSPNGPGALIGYLAARTAYNTVGVAIINASVTFLSREKGGLFKRGWTMWSEPKTFKGNTWHQSRIKPGKETTPEMIAFLESLKF